MRRELYLFTLLLLLPGVAWADNLYVDCTGGPLAPGVYPSINAALTGGASDPNRDYNIFITGTCVEKVSLYRRSGIYFIGQDDNASVESPAPPNRGPVFNLVGSKHIWFKRLNVRNGAPGIQLLEQSSAVVLESTIEGNSIGISAGHGSHVSVGTDALPVGRGVLIRNNSPSGIFANASIVDVFGSTFESNGGGGSISLQGGRLWMRAVSTENLVQNNMAGINLSDNAFARIEGQNTIRDNGFNGLVLNGSGAWISEVVRQSDGTVRTTTIEGHFASGIAVTRAGTINMVGRHVIRNNGFNCPSLSQCGGIRAFEGVAQLSGGVEISGNTGAGVVAKLNGSVVIVTPVTVTGNTEGDILLMLLSGAEILAGGTTPNMIGSVTCDDTSVLGGEVAGIGTIACKAVAAPKKK